jgi:hypothetical protein
MNMNKQEAMKEMAGPASRLLVIAKMMQDAVIPRNSELAQAAGVGMMSDLMALCSIIDQVAGFTEADVEAIQTSISSKYTEIMGLSKRLAAQIEEARMDDIDLVAPTAASAKAFDDLIEQLAGGSK